MNNIHAQVLRRVLDVLPVRDVVHERADEVVVLNEVGEVDVAFGVLLVGFLCEMWAGWSGGEDRERWIGEREGEGGQWGRGGKER